MLDKDLKVKELIKLLDGMDKNSTVEFHFLDKYNLTECKVESIIEEDERVDITIQTVHGIFNLS